MNKDSLCKVFEVYKSAFQRLDTSTKLKAFNDIVYDGVIQRFEVAFEIGLSLMQEYLEYTGILGIRESIEVIREAYTIGLIEDGDQWIDMLVDRNKTSQLYDEEEVRLIYEKIINAYNPLLLKLVDVLEMEIKNTK